LHFCSFCKPTFSGATREWDALYKATFSKGICRIDHEQQEQQQQQQQQQHHSRHVKRRVTPIRGQLNVMRHVGVIPRLSSSTLYSRM
jgi:hypothetical protein